MLKDTEAARTIFNSSVDKLADWLAVQQTDPELSSLILSYLWYRGDNTMLSPTSRHSRYTQLALLVDQLGFRNFMEGRIPKLLVALCQEDISRRHLRKHAGHWGNGLILHLLQITHRQWTFRNGTVHFRNPDHLTRSQQTYLER